MADQDTALAEVAALISAASRCGGLSLDPELGAVLDRLDLNYGDSTEKTEAALRDALEITTPRKREGSSSGMG